MRVAQLAPFVAACKPLCQRRHAPCLQPAAPRLQVANLVFFVADGALQFWTGVSLTIPALGTPAGILLADLTGLVVQWCLFKANGIPLANGGGAVGNATASRCPF